MVQGGGTVHYQPSPQTQAKYRALLMDYMHHLEEAVRGLNFDAVETIGHKISGNAGLFGHAELGQLAQELRMQVKVSSLRGIHAKFDEMLAYVKKNFP
ncbi:MAG: Hpt domain-containing protein [Bacteriovoracia bacterium]